MSSSNPPSRQFDSDEEKSISEIEKYLYAVVFASDDKELNLHLAALRDLLTSKPELLDARFDSQTKRNEVPLLYLCRYCAFQGMAYLLELGANPNVKNERGQTALELILEIRQFDEIAVLPIVDAFLRHCADITPQLIKLADENDFHNISFYLAKYAEERPFRMAVKNNNMKEVKQCLANGFPCDIMPGGKNLIAFAREAKQPEMEKFFSDIATLFDIASGPTSEDIKQFNTLFRKYLPDILIYVTRGKHKKTLFDIAHEAEVGDARSKQDLIELIQSYDRAKEYKVELKEVKEKEKRSKAQFFNAKVKKKESSQFEPATKGQGSKRKREESKDQNPRSPKKGFSSKTD